MSELRAVIQGQGFSQCPFFLSGLPDDSITSGVMMDRRTFATILGGSIAAPRRTWAQVTGATVKTVFYSSVGGDLTLYSMNVEEASLVKRDTVTLPANVQYAWPHPSKQYLYGAPS